MLTYIGYIGPSQAVSVIRIQDERVHVEFYQSVDLSDAQKLALAGLWDMWRETRCELDTRASKASDAFTRAAPHSLAAVSGLIPEALRNADRVLRAPPPHALDPVSGLPLGQALDEWGFAIGPFVRTNASSAERVAPGLGRGCSETATGVSSSSRDAVECSRHFRGAEDRACAADGSAGSGALPQSIAHMDCYDQERYPVIAKVVGAETVCMLLREYDAAQAAQRGIEAPGLLGQCPVATLAAEAALVGMHEVHVCAAQQVIDFSAFFTLPDEVLRAGQVMLWLWEPLRVDCGQIDWVGLCQHAAREAKREEVFRGMHALAV